MIPAHTKREVALPVARCVVDSPCGVCRIRVSGRGYQAARSGRFARSETILSDDSMCNHIESMNRPVLELDGAQQGKSEAGAGTGVAKTRARPARPKGMN